MRTASTMRDDWMRYIHLLTKTMVEMRRRKNDLEGGKDDFAGLFDLALKLGIMRQILRHRQTRQS